MSIKARITGMITYYFKFVPSHSFESFNPSFHFFFMFIIKTLKIPKTAIIP